MSLCLCSSWARPPARRILTDHHPACSQYAQALEREVERLEGEAVAMRSMITELGNQLERREAELASLGEVQPT